MRILTDTGLTKAFQAVKSWAEGAFAALSHSHESATSKVSGFMSVEDKKKLDNISPNANAYVHPSYPLIEDSFTKVGRDKTGHVIIGELVEKSDIVALGIPAQDTVYEHPTDSGNRHVPSGGSEGQILRWASDGTAAWSDEAGGASYDVATRESDGLMSSGDKSKLDSIADNANDYTHPGYSEVAEGFRKVGRDATGHVVSTAAVTKSDITALGIPGQDTTYQSKAAASGGTDLSLVTTGEKAVWNAKTSNAGTVTKVSAGVGLAGGDITGSGTVKAKLRSETALANASAAATETAGRVYPVAQDKDGYLAVNVPWVDTNTQTITGVKGNSESAYRTGQVNLTAANIMYLGSNVTVGKANDTYAFWQNKGTGYAWFLTNDMLNGQPCQYGFVINIVVSGEVHQEFWGQNGRDHYYRGAHLGDTDMPAWKPCDTTYSAATQSAAGLMSAADKAKLDNLSGGGGVVVASTAPAGDSSKLWIDTASGGVAKYWNGTAWTACKSVWG